MGIPVAKSSCDIYFDTAFIAIVDCGMGVNGTVRSCLIIINEYMTNVIQSCYVLINSLVKIISSTGNYHGI